MRHDVLRQVLGLGVVDVAVVHSVLHTARAEGDVVVHHPRGAVRHGQSWELCAAEVEPRAGDTALSDYEKVRENNIRERQEMLRALGITSAAAQDDAGDEN